jgi:hypothetical protein
MRCLEICISTLHETFGPLQGMYDYPEKRIRRTNRVDTIELDIVICTTGQQHLVSELRLAKPLFRHHSTKAEPTLLGYECHDVLRSHLGQYDIYGYLEDDIQVLDPLFFIKLDWFRRRAGNEALLQPNRYEASIMAVLTKLYVDSNLVDKSISPHYQDNTVQPKLRYQAFDRNYDFQRVDNPHSGCFFLSAEQMAMWAKKPYFLDRATGFWGPLESAATLGIMRTFRIYKPSKENASFLEVRHIDNRYLANRMKISADMIEPK